MKEDRLSVINIISKTYLMLWQNLPAVLANSIFPTLLLFCLSYIEVEVLTSETFLAFVNDNLENQSLATGLVSLIASLSMVLLFPLIPFFTTSSCFVVHKIDYKSCFWTWRWTDRELKVLKIGLFFLCLSIFTYLLSFLVLMLDIPTKGKIETPWAIIVFLMIAIITFYVPLRLCLFIPSSALGLGLSLKQIWKLTKGRTILIFWLLVFGPLSVSIFFVPAAFSMTVFYGKDSLSFDEFEGYKLIFLILLNSFFDWIYVVVILNLLSNLILRLRGKGTALT